MIQQQFFKDSSDKSPSYIGASDVITNVNRSLIGNFRKFTVGKNVFASIESETSIRITSLINVKRATKIDLQLQVTDIAFLSDTTLLAVYFAPGVLEIYNVLPGDSEKTDFQLARVSRSQQLQQTAGGRMIHWRDAETLILTQGRELIYVRIVKDCNYVNHTTCEFEQDISDVAFLQAH